VTAKPDDDGREPSEGWEALEEEASAGSLAPSQELEEALREAAEAVETRESTRGGRRGRGASSEEVERLQAELEAVKDRYLRLQADFENFRRRTLKEREESARYGHENLVKDLLATVDNLDRAIDHARQSGGGDFESMLQGVELVQRELMGVLAKHGVEPIEAEGQPFDPNLHEAMAQEESDEVPPGTVVRVLQKGYALRDRLLRPTRVMVSRRSSQEDT
jgi:molecular chaperone GrpE